MTTNPSPLFPLFFNFKFFQSIFCIYISMLVHTYIYNIVLIDNINTNFYTSFRFLLNFEPIDSTTRVIIHAAAFRRRLEVGCGMAEHEIPEGTANLWRRKRCGEPRRAKPYHLRRFESPSFLPEHSIDSREREVVSVDWYRGQRLLADRISKQISILFSFSFSLFFY